MPGALAAPTGWPGWVWPALAGAAMALNQPPFFVPIGVLGLAFGFWMLTPAPSRRHAAWLGWMLGIGYFGVTMHWIVEPFLVDAARHGWMAPFAWLFMAAGLALFWAWAGWMAAWLRPGPTRLIALALSFAFAEWLRGTVLTGFAWLPIGFMISHGPGGPLLALWGPYGTGLLTTALAAALVWAVRQPGRPWVAFGPLISMIVMVGLSAGFGLRPEHPQVEAPMLRLVQPNAPQHLKWLPGHRERFYQRAVSLSATKADRSPDLILWPESAIPAWLNNAGAEIAEISLTSPAPVLAGIRRYSGTRYFNSAALIDDNTALSVYDKHHLVPFGEYIPFGAVLARFGIYGLAAEDGGGYSAGPGADMISVAGIGLIRVLICYEAVFPQHSRLDPRPRALVNLTNDAWFGQWAGPQQHLAHARARALEQGLPMIRAANTGISAVIAPNGRVLADLPLGVAGHLDHPLPTATEPTLYAKTGDLPFLICIFLSFCVILLRDWRKPD